MAIFILSDLHLCAERPLATRAFNRFLSEHAPHAQAVYLLGDLVEYWIGDDTLEVDPPDFIDPLRAVTDSGVAVFFMHGNRDFLMGSRFAAATGCRMLADPTVEVFFGIKTLLMHGDTLCVDDVAYQRFRTLVRDPHWQRDFLSKSYSERTTLAQSARTESRQHARDQPEYIMDVNQSAVEDAMRRAGVSRLIHGHTHRPDTHHFHLDGQPAERIVLGDWYQHASALRLDASGIQTIQLIP